MFNFSTKHLLLVTAFVAVVIYLCFEYQKWRITYRLTDFKVAFLVDDEPLPIADGIVQIPGNKIDNGFVGLLWNYGFANNDGYSNRRGNVEHLHANSFIEGVRLRQTANSSAGQDLVEDSGISTRFYWSAETVSGGAIVYTVVHLYKDGKIIDTKMNTFHLIVESSSLNAAK